MFVNDEIAPLCWLVIWLEIMTCYNLNKPNVWVGTCEPAESYFNSLSGMGCEFKNSFLEMGSCVSRDGSRIYGKGVLIYKSVGIRFADSISFFLNIPWK